MNSATKSKGTVIVVSINDLDFDLNTNKVDLTGRFAGTNDLVSYYKTQGSSQLWFVNTSYCALDNEIYYLEGTLIS